MKGPSDKSVQILSEVAIACGGVIMVLPVALLVLTAIALSLSTRLGTAPTLAICVVIFMVGLLSDFLVGQYAAGSPLAAFIYKVIPDWQHFWVSDALTGGGRVPGSYLLNAGLYAAAYCAAVLCIGLFAFRCTEMT